MQNAIKQELLETGESTPVVGIIGTVYDGVPTKIPNVHFIAVPQLGDPRVKEHALEALRKQAKEEKAIGVLIAFEAWMAFYPSAEEERTARELGVTPSKRQDRIEALILTVEHVCLRQPEMWHARILREGKTVRLDEWHGMPGEADGRFTDVLDRLRYQ